MGLIHFITSFPAQSTFFSGWKAKPAHRWAERQSWLVSSLNLQLPLFLFFFYSYWFTTFLSNRCFIFSAKCGFVFFAISLSVSSSYDLCFYSELWCLILPEYQPWRSPSFLYVMGCTGCISSFYVALAFCILLAVARSFDSTVWMTDLESTKSTAFEKQFVLQTRFCNATFMVTISLSELD